MRFLTYNLWHGLAPSSPVTMAALEPSSRLHKREKMQFDLLSKLNFDVGFFQEVNPLKDRCQTLSLSLEKEAISQPDLVGVKVLGVGLPGNLNSGLMILSAPQYQMRKVQGLKLSGQGSSIVSPWFSLQFREERFALLGEVITPKWGRVLVVNAHLHHGLEWTEDLEKDLTEVSKNLQLSSAVQTELFERVKRGNERRLREMKTLMGVLSKMSDRYSIMVVAGDFNARPDGELGALFSEFGFKDSFKMKPQSGELYTYDREKNVANHMLQLRFPLTVKFDDLTFSDQVRASLTEVFGRHESRPRRIDQMWIKSQLDLDVSTRLVGFPEGEDGFAPSDHFGYVVDIL